MPHKKINWEQTAHKLAKVASRGTHSVLNDFGRTLEYYRPLQNLIKKNLPKIEGAKILHVGSSSGLLIRDLQSRGATAIAFDLNKLGARISKEIGNKRTITGDALMLPFKSNSVDAIISDHFVAALYAFVTRHPSKVSERDWKVLDEMKRVLKKGGVAFVYRYNIENYPDLIKRAEAMGFSVVEKGTKKFKDPGKKTDFFANYVVLKKN